jgi:hypothetical protein
MLLPVSVIYSCGPGVSGSSLAGVVELENLGKVKV